VIRPLFEMSLEICGETASPVVPYGLTRQWRSNRISHLFRARNRFCARIARASWRAGLD
jgi:hypothetical protein